MTDQDHNEAGEKPKRTKRTAVLLLLLGTLVFVSVLAFLRVRSTEIELYLELSEISFVLSAAQPITEAVRVESLGISGLTSIELPRSRQRGGEAISEQSILLAPADRDDRAGTIDLGDVPVASGTRVWLRTTDVPDEYRVSFQGSAPELAVSLDGPVHVTVPGALNEELNFAVPRQLTLHTGDDVVDIEFRRTEGSPMTFSSQLDVEGLHFFRMDEYHAHPDGPIVRQVSTIRSGTLFLESLDGRAHELRPAIGLHFETSRGAIRELVLDSGQLLVRFHGRVTGMSSGSGEVRRSLMPTLLEWFRTRHAFSLLWGTSAYVFGLLLAAYRWWLKPK